MSVARRSAIGAMLLAALGGAALAQQAGSLGEKTVVHFRMADLGAQQGTIWISSNYQVLLELPRAVDAIGGNKQKNVQVTVLSPPQDRFVLLDAMVNEGRGDLTVIVGGKPLMFKLVVDNKHADGKRRYIVDEDTDGPSDVTPALSPASPTPTAPVAAPNDQSVEGAPQGGAKSKPSAPTVAAKRASTPAAAAKPKGSVAATAAKGGAAKSAPGTARPAAPSVAAVKPGASAVATKTAAPDSATSRAALSVAAIPAKPLAGAAGAAQTAPRKYTTAELLAMLREAVLSRPMFSERARSGDAAPEGSKTPATGW